MQSSHLNFLVHLQAKYPEKYVTEQSSSVILFNFIISGVGTDFTDNEGDKSLLENVSEDVSDTSFNTLSTDIASCTMLESPTSWLISQLLLFEAIRENIHVLLNDVRIILTVGFLLYPPFWRNIEKDFQEHLDLAYLLLRTICHYFLIRHLKNLIHR